MNLKKLNDQEISQYLKNATLWRREGDEITRTYTFPSFLESITFVNQIAAHAETVNHHPDMLIQYSKVTLRLNTHDVGGLSYKDFEFAQAADGIHC